MMLSFGEAVRRFYGNYVNADGRAQRSAYWWAQLYQIIIYAVLVIVLFMADGGDQILGIIGQALEGNANPDIDSDFSLGASGIFAIILILCFALANILPNIMLSIRRFHDLNHSGWLVLLFFVIGQLPVIGTIAGLANMVWFAIPGTNGQNKYGPDPLGQDMDIFG